MNYLDENSVDRLLDYPGLVDALQTAHAGQGMPETGALVMESPASADDKFVSLMAWAADDMIAAKLVGVFPDNMQLCPPQPTVQGIVALFDGKTGAPLLICDGGSLTRRKTAADSALGAKLLFYPYSSAVGSVMVKADSPLRSLGDLKGRVVAVAGGPLDKGWLIVQAAAIRQGIDLKREATLQYGAPPLIFQKLQQGEAEASLNYWNFCARLEAQGYRRLLDVREAEVALGLEEPVALIGYAFSEDFVTGHKGTIDRFIAIVQNANDIMRRSDEEWDALRPLMNAEDQSTFQAYRDQTREGMPRRTVKAEQADARALFRTLADIGGPELVGPLQELDPGLYYQNPPQTPPRETER